MEAPLIEKLQIIELSNMSREIKKLQRYCIIISSPLDTIEACGGGSARCMISEIFLPKAN